MKQLLLTMTISVVFTTVARADQFLANSTADDFTVEVTLPNGKIQKRNLGRGDHAINTARFTVATGVKQSKFTVLDDTGATVWTGTLKDSDYYLLVRTGKTVTGAYAGTATSANPPRAATIMNLTGEAVTLDLEGNNGIGAHRNITPGTSFDEKKAVRLDPKESTFTLMVKAKGADPVKAHGTNVQPGRYYVLIKNDEGYRLDQLGSLATARQ